MPVLDYVAISANSGRVTGSLEAESIDAAARKLSAKGLIVLKLAPPSRGSRLWQTLNQDVTARRTLNSAEIATLMRDWGNLVAAGISLPEALAVSENGASSRLMRKVTSSVRSAVSEGSSLHDALAGLEGQFPADLLALIKSAESVGQIGETLSRIGDDLEAHDRFRADVRNALLYPAFVAVTAVVVLVVLLTIVVPNIETLIADTNAKSIPLVTSMVIGVSRSLREYGLFIALGLGLLASALLAARRVRRWRTVSDRWLLQLPVLGNLIKLIETARLLRVLSELLNGGVSPARALPLAAGTLRNRAMQAKLQIAQTKILQGASLTAAMEEAGCLHSEAVQVVRVGDRTGRLAELAAKAAASYEHRSRSKLKDLATILGPASTAVLGLVAGIIIYAVMTTILSLNELAFQ